MLDITFAEKRREDMGGGCYCIRYLVYNGDTIGSYGVHFGPSGPYGASRDYHQIATAEMQEGYRRYRRWVDVDDMEGDWPEGAVSIEPHPCCYHDGKPCICDGSSLVEVIHAADEGDTSSDQRAFAIAAMMAER